MTEPEAALEAIKGELSAMEHHWRSVSEYVELLVILTTHKDAESAIDGIHRLLHQIDTDATAVGEHWKAAWQALRCD
ncbi:hypothetical protein [Bradyrhizobium ottawaense]|uniref:hypothetical protein n=1 Tax=Bradyrhizobium ottawaense TaxID=931866 RepID=UPI001BAD5628|nr:hypothetical protein [Bradyrhizobium ottawaense]MBR1362944.1 hypothetical protein [Bradyrhizobium ottawaense]